jgi:DNA-binding CsgD family transcriptional regulator
VTLLGRLPECKALDSLLASVRGGLSGTLVLRGDPGIGKTALLDYAVGAAPDFLVVRFAGLEAERQLGFAALHRLLLPIVHQIQGLPVPQRDAMTSALGLAAGPPANRFLVGLGTISLAARAARVGERLLAIIDDAQWVDRESLEALAFWGRRLHADRIALIFGELSEAASHDLLDDFPVLEVGRLDDAPAIELLNSEAGFVLDRDVAERIVTETEGNPLALVEIGKDLAPDQLIGAAATQPLPISRRLEERFLRQVRSLPADTQMLLLLAAADSSADARLVWDAASVLGVGAPAAAPAESAGLLTLGPRVRYRHPLIRSAVYGGARPADRRAVHNALATVTDADVDPDRRAWHLAAAAVGTDEAVATLLEQRAERARARGGHSAEMALLSRSAELTPDPERAAARQLLAAEAALSVGSPRQAHVLVSMAGAARPDPSMRSRADRVDGLASRREGDVAAAAPKLLAAGRGLGATDPALGRQTLLDAVQAANYAGYSAAHEFMQAVARAILPAPPDRSLVELLLSAFATNASAGYAAAVPSYQSAVRAMRDDVPARDLLPWVTVVSACAVNVWDNTGHGELCRRATEASREQGVLVPLGTALTYGAYGEMWAGRLESAGALFAEATDVYSAAGEHHLPQMDCELDAIRGRDAEVHAKAQMATAIGDTMGLGAYANTGRMALVVLHLGRSRYEEARREALVLFDADPIQALPHAISDLVEAAARAGDRPVAERGLGRLAERAQAAATPWALGLLARSMALIAGEEGELFYRDAIERLGAARMAIEAARAHLVYGEWLRRQKRRTDARESLRTAYESFAGMGAEPFAERARRELLATGERARKRSVGTSTDLTPQEAHVARLAVAGATNAEIAAQLFIGTSTVEYHLRKVFRKLDVTSRRQLKRSLPDSVQDGAAELPASRP